MNRIESSGQLWAAIASGRPALLMLDYDGTLAPYNVHREKAVPLADVPMLLTAIAALPLTTVAVVSGRPVLELLRLLGSLPMIMVGEHGWETRPPHGPLVKYPLPEPARVGLREAASQASSRGWAGSLEMKRTSVVLHTRGLPPARAATLERECGALWSQYQQPGLLRLEPLSAGLELRAEGYGKGAAVRELVERCPADAVCVFVGDDVTDEEAFVELGAGGLGIVVGPPPERPTHARAALASPDEVRAFLRRWLAAAQSGDPAARGPGLGASSRIEMEREEES